MTDPDDYKRLADRLIAQDYGNVKDIETMGEHFALLAECAAALRTASVKAGEVVAWRDVVKRPDERPLPTYGQIPWDQLGRDVVESTTARRDDYKFAENLYPGHQIVPGINFNSLARIVDKYRYYGLPCEDESRIRSALVAEPAPTASVGAMREALDRAHGKFCLIAGTKAWTDSCLDGWKHSPGALRDYAEQAAKEIDEALAAANQSDGGVRTAPASCPNCFNEDDCANVDICNAVADVYRPSVPPPAPQADYITTRFNEVTCERTDTCTWPDCKCPRKTPPAPQAVEAVSVDEVAHVIALSYARNDLEPSSKVTLALYWDDSQHAARALLAKFKMEGR